uniref:IF rod domain-containing protein n=1 Tax=Leptobrachium leishanense TaxID=445787 RepID=A0A8C5QWZ2_9ANUR
MRDQYETIIAKNQKDAEVWFNTKSEELNHEVTSSAQQLQTVHTEIIELRQTTQNLEIELQTQNSMKAALENTLAEVDARYGCQLSQIQDLINNVQEQLANLRSDMEQQNHDHRIAMDAKSRLEQEIAQYKQMLDGEEIHRGSWNARDIRDGSSGTSGGSSYSSTSGNLSYSSGHKPRTVVEDVSDGYSSTKRE